MSLLRAASMVSATVNEIPDLPAPALVNLLGMAGEVLYRRDTAPADAEISRAGAYQAGGNDV